AAWAAVAPLPGHWPAPARAAPRPAAATTSAGSGGAARPGDPSGFRLVLVQVAEHMAQLASLGAQIVAVVRVEAGEQRLALGDADAEAFQRIHLAWVIGHQLERMDAQVVEHRQTDAVFALVGGKAQALVGFHGVGAA